MHRIFMHLSSVLLILFITTTIAVAFERKEFIKKDHSANNANKAAADDISQDLIVAAQSYFIEPEIPSSTTVKPTFKRRKTLRPISSLTEKKKGLNHDDPDSSTLSQSSTTPFNPFRQIVNTGFAKKRHSTQKPSHPDLNSKSPEVNEIHVTTEKSDNVLEQTAAPREVLRRRKTTPGLLKLADAARQPAIKKSHPNRFASAATVGGARRPNKINGSLRPTESTSTTTSPDANVEGNENNNNNEEPMSSTVSPSSISPPRGNFRGGRQGGFILKPKPTVRTDAVGTETENKGKQIRRRPSTNNRPPALAALASAPGENVGRQRRPGRVPSKEIVDAGAIIKFESAPVDLIPTNFTPKTPATPTTAAVAGNSNNKVRRGKAISSRNNQQQPAIVSDSEHESSDPIPSSVVEADGTPVAVPDSAGNEKTSSTSDVLNDSNYRPRNLSNRNSNSNSNNPLDKLSNRQAAASRFLTPKARSNQNGEATPAAPVAAQPISPLRKSPLLSLSNLKNRRLGHTTTTTTELPLVSESSDNAAAVTAGQNETGSNSTSANAGGESPGKPDETPAGDEKTEGEDAESLKDADQSSFTLPGNKNKVRPPIKTPGGIVRKPFMARAPNSKLRTGGAIHTTTTTTVKPAQETTPTPTCEDGKRYNKILKKCIPSYVHRSG